MGVAVERNLFAGKGRAKPAGVPTAAAAAPEPPIPVAPPPPAPLQASLPMPGTAEETGSEAAPPRVDAHPAGAGSLLTFRLRGGADRPSLSEALKASLIPPAEVEPGPQPAATAPAPPFTSAPAAAVPAPPQVATSAAPQTELPPAEPASVAQPAAEAPAPPAPRFERPASGRLDRPLFPRTTHAAAQRAAAAEPATPSVAPHALPSASIWRTVMPIGLAVAAIALVGWLMARTGSEDGGTEAPAPTVASVAPASKPAAPAPSADAAPASDVVASSAPQPDQPAPAPSEPAAVAEPDAAEPDFTAADTASVATAEPTPAAIAAAPLDAPTFEVVRVEPGAPPVLAGRAVPGSRLIVLDNGEPIGSATADGNGEWALVSDVPLPPGRHELSLALKTADGTVVVEQAEAEAMPASHTELQEGLPVPPQKPAAGAAAARSYVVQLASVPSAADAEREWVRLQQAYPDLLGSRSADIDAAEIGDRGIFYRVRTGPFEDRGAARELCRALNGAGQECLVVREASTD